jgi:hypothetical protein
MPQLTERRVQNGYRTIGGHARSPGRMSPRLPRRPEVHLVIAAGQGSDHLDVPRLNSGRPTIGSNQLRDLVLYLGDVRFG